MALIECPECSKKVSDKAKSCPNCGYPFAKEVPTNILAKTGENRIKGRETDNYVSTELGFFDIMDGFTIKKNIVCPYCQKRGCVATKPIKMKKGISGGKATAALLTGGISMLATGLSRKEKVTEAKCKNCKSEWHF